MRKAHHMQSSINYTIEDQNEQYNIFKWVIHIYQNLAALLNHEINRNGYINFISQI